MHTMQPPARRRQDAPRPYREAARRAGDLSYDEEMVLGRRIQAGDADAFDELIEANHGLVRYYVLRSAHLLRGLDFEDAVQEGMLGLMRAAKCFDPDRGTRFSTYATRWIRQKIQRAIHTQSLAIRVPEYLWRAGTIGDHITPVGSLAVLDSDPPARATAEGHALDRPREKLAELLATMPAEDRELLWRYATDPDGSSHLSTGRFRMKDIPRAEWIIAGLREQIAREEEGAEDDE